MKTTWYVSDNWLGRQGKLTLCADRGDHHLKIPLEKFMAGAHLRLEDILVRLAAIGEIELDAMERAGIPLTLRALRAYNLMNGSHVSPSRWQFDFPKMTRELWETVVKDVDSTRSNASREALGSNGWPEGWSISLRIDASMQNREVAVLLESKEGSVKVIQRVLHDGPINESIHASGINRILREGK